MGVKQSPFARDTVCSDSLLEDMRAIHSPVDKDSICNDSMVDYQSAARDRQTLGESDFDHIPSIHLTLSTPRCQESFQNNVSAFNTSILSVDGDSEALNIVDVCESPVTWDSFRRACSGAAMIAVCAHERPRPAPRKSRLMIGYRAGNGRRVFTFPLSHIVSFLQALLVSAVLKALRITVSASFSMASRL